MSSSSSLIPAIYTVDQIQKAIATPGFQEELIDGIQNGFVALERGEFFAPPIQTLGLPPFEFVSGVDGYAAQTCIKTGYFKGQEHYVVKVASGGFPLENSGMMQIYSQRTGKLEALLLDNGILTELRTAAVGALATKLLGPKSIGTIGIVGTGIQAKYQLEMLSAVSPCKSVLVWGRTSSNVEAYVSEFAKKGYSISSVASSDELLEKCDIIVTTTCSREAILGNFLPATTKCKLITCIGADAPGKYELNPTIVAKADLLVADHIDQSAERGEFQKAIADGLILQESIVSLGKLIEQETLHRKNGDDRLIIVDSSGVALQDCVISSLVVQKLF
ncbi:ornithine cyclodeaminase [Nitzschia inconspicua]|uniref:Ornithine cyclodeaminase n=1 Tax=Nitzschia inconspicua TaxID=303405 RepID=A0A9K3P9J3_9STRA|nr:ornithine cyclodeaminase [Nitzschia inconspicua]KAG7352143.1 ornithine cyclodeaminase [Nitzschia inconspicua]